MARLAALQWRRCIASRFAERGDREPFGMFVEDEFKAADVAAVDDAQEGHVAA